MIEKQILKQIDQEAEKLSHLISEGAEWSSLYLKDEQKNEVCYSLKKIRRQVNHVRSVILEKPSLALFGASQVGKSYMANNLLYNPQNKLEVVDHQTGENIDFIKWINPEGRGNEATSAVTRFTSEKTAESGNFPVLLKIFHVRDILCILCDSYYNDYSDGKKSPRGPEIEKLLEELRALPKTYSSKILTDDDVYSIKEYVEKYFFENGTIQELDKYQYWNQVADQIGDIPIDYLSRIFSILWNHHEEITRIFNESVSFLQRFNFPSKLYVTYEALYRKSGYSIINVQTLRSFFSESIQFAVRTESGQEWKADAARLCFLTAEIVMTISEQSVQNRPFIREIDIIDFPGARSRPEIISFTEDSLLEMMLRGKVSYLFNHYSHTYKTNILGVCMRTQQTNVTTVPRLVNQWIEDNLGDTPQKRAQNISGPIPPLFIIFTWWNTQLTYNIATDDPDPKDRIQKLFHTRFHEEIIAGYKWHENWMSSANGIDPFRNFYLLRDFKESKMLYKSDDEQPSSAELNEFTSPEQQNFFEKYKQSFLEFHTQENRFFTDPLLNFEESSVPGKDGSEFIIKNLKPVANNDVSVPIYMNYLRNCRDQAEELLKRHFHSDEADVQIAKAASEAADIVLKMTIVFGADALSFGRFIEMLTIKESEIFNLYHSLLKSDKLTGGTKNNPYVLLRLTNPELSEELDFDSNLEILRKNYSIPNKDAVIEKFKKDNIDLHELFYGDQFNLMNNSLILAQEARNYWFEKNLHTDRFEEFIQKGFEKNQLNRLFEMYRVSFKRLNLVKKIADSIRDYVDVDRRIERAEDMIAHISSGIINEFVTSAGWQFLSQAEKDKLQETNQANNLNLSFPNDKLIFESIRRIDLSGQSNMSLNDLINFMDRLAEELNARPVKKEMLKYVPMLKNYQQWINVMKIAFIANCDIPTYDLEANNQLKKVLDHVQQIELNAR
jgi:hypothetical protein